MDWSSYGGSENFVAYYLVTGTVQIYPAEQIAPVKRQKVDDCPFVLGMPSAVDVNWLSNVSRKKFSETKCDYRRYRVVVDDDSGQPAVVPTDVVDDIDVVLAQQALWEGDGALCYTTADQSDIAESSGSAFKNSSRFGIRLLQPFEPLG